ncbi:MAG: hypothetical protein R3293_06555 [Candidatus Promineifilaceae bacterium]|nr:hypothetical protein [Candidatus Promineifilaceae bacterium]
MKRITLTFLSITLGSIALLSLASILRFGGMQTLLANDGKMMYTISDLGTLGGPESYATDINNEGQIIGNSTISDGGPSKAFLWEEGTMISLTVSTAVTTHAYAINDLGWVAGAAVSGENEAQNQWPIIWANDTYTQLATISETMGTARAVNELGLIAGNSISESNNHLFIWQDSALSNSVPISDGIAWVNGINESNQLVGYIHDLQGKDQAFLWATGTFTPLGSLGGTSSIAHEINDLDQIVGSSYLSDEITSHAFLWENGSMTDLGTLANVSSEGSQALGVNNEGVIVGSAQVGQEHHAVIWKNDQIYDLNDLIPAESGWDLLQKAESINDQGWIAGTGLIEGHSHAFLLRPSPPLLPVYLPIVTAPESTPTPTLTPTPTPTPTPMPSGVMDMNRFLIGDGRLYEVKHSTGSQARHQTQIDDWRFFHTKGEGFLRSEWEELWSKNNYIYRGTDTSPGNGRYYSLYASDTPGSPVGSKWSPRYWRVGDTYERNAYVVVRNKTDCSLVPNLSGWANTWLRFEAYHPNFTFASGITLQNVIELAWLLNENSPAQERYYYAENFGLVGWSSADAGHSYINEIHQPGQRPDNSREVIPCLDDLHKPLIYSSKLNHGPLPAWYLRKIK